MLTRNQRGDKSPTDPSTSMLVRKWKSSIKQIKKDLHTLKTPALEVKILKKNDLEPAFDIVEFCKSFGVQIPPVDYLQSNPSELDKLIEFVKGSSSPISTQQINIVSNPEPFIEPRGKLLMEETSNHV